MNEDWTDFDLTSTLIDTNEGLPDETIGGPFFVYWEY